MNNTWFTSDWHLNETRFDIMFRPFKTAIENDTILLNNFMSVFKDGDTLFHLGDVIYKCESSEDYKKYESIFKDIRKKFPNSQFILIEGNYDVDSDLKIQLYKILFTEIYESLSLSVKNIPMFLNHYPTKVNAQELFGITGHIHSLWKVQKNMINVGVDAWNYMPVDLDKLLFTKNAIDNYYDENVFING